MKRSEGKQEAAVTKSGGRKLKIIRSAIKLIEKRMGDKDVRISLMDLIRLMEMESELTEQRAGKEITVSWVDQNQSGRSTQSSPPAEEDGEELIPIE